MTITRRTASTSVAFTPLTVSRISLPISRLMTWSPSDSTTHLAARVGRWAARSFSEMRVALRKFSPTNSDSEWPT